ncbi:hypothetical protein PBRA_009210 [Plasmodiophora brassicae]|uniref:Peptidase S54 rhomboid domain-containing protein n=1 Tax=Plasmodiophora brassicae TaxID=37360 RepID=A0A0G4J644_PLABS|nr:hypothetical protein PBRA_009210 [Plasmodiophora brassicae]
MERGAGARRPHVVYRYIVAQRGGSACSAFAATLSALLTLAGVALVVLSQTGHIQLHGPPPAASSDNHNKDNDKQVVQVATSATEQEKKGWFRRYVRDQPVTTALVLANTIQFVRARDWDNFLSAPHAPTTVSLGSVQGVSPGRALKQIVGAAFHHGSFQHFALNMRALWSFGAVVERDLGSLKMLTVYLAGVLSGTLTDFAYQQRGKSRWNPVVGASGGIVALMGANGVTWPLSGTLGPALVQVVLLALFDGQKLKYMEALTDSEVIPEALRQVSHLSHLGGWVVGIA